MRIVDDGTPVPPGDPSRDLPPYGRVPPQKREQNTPTDTTRDEQEDKPDA